MIDQLETNYNQAFPNTGEIIETYTIPAKQD